MTGNILRGLFRVAAAFLALTFAVMILLNIPAVQTFITQKIGKTLSEQTGAGVSVGRVKIVLTGYLNLRDVLITTPGADTIVYAGNISVSANLLKALRKEINVASTEIEVFKANIARNADGRFNFDFIIDALANGEAKEEEADAAPFDWKISVGIINLSEFNISFRDEAAGMEAGINLGRLVVKPDQFDLQNMGFFIDEVALDKTSVNVKIWETSTAATHEEPEKNSDEQNILQLPEFGLNLLKIHNFSFDFDDLTSGTKTTAGLDELVFKPGQLNLNSNSLHLGTLDISGFTAHAEIFSDTTSTLPDIAIPANNPPLNLHLKDISAGWDIAMKRLAIENSSLKFDDNAFGPADFGLDANHIFLKNLNLKIEDMVLNETQVGMKLSEFSFDEQSGLTMQKLAFETGVSEMQFHLEGLEVITPQSKISGGFSANYSSLNQLIKHPETAEIDLKIMPSKINTNEVFLLLDFNPQDTLMAKYANLQVDFEIAAQGLADSIQLSKLDFSLPGNTTFESFGTFSQLFSRPEKPAVDFTINKFETTGGEIIALSDSSYFGGFRLPEYLSLFLNVSGTPDDATFAMQLETEAGNLETSGFYNASNPDIKDRFAARLILGDVRAGYFLQDTTIGTIGLTANIGGERSHQDSLTATFSLNDIVAGYLGYTYRDIKITGALEKSNASISVTSSDENVKFDLEASTKTDSTKTTFAVDLAVEMFNLYNLYLSDEKTALRTKIGATGFFGGSDDLSATIKITDTEIISENEVISTGEILIQPAISAAGTALELNSQILHLVFDSNMLPKEMAEVMRLAIDRYLGKSDTTRLPAGKQMNLAATLNVPDAFRERFVPDLKQIITDTLAIRYQSDQNSLNATFGIPVAAYQNALLENFNLSVDAAGDSLHLVTGFESLIFDTLQVPRLHVEQFFKGGNIRSAITFGQENENNFYRFLNRINISEEETIVAFAENGLTLNGNLWQVNPNNRLVIKDSLLTADHFGFTLDSSRIALQTTDSLQRFIAENFPVSDLTAMVVTPSGSNLVGGFLHADVVLPLHEPFSGISAGISINKLMLMGALIGNLDFELTERTEYLEIALAAQTAFNSIRGEGKIGKTASPQPIDFSIDLEIDDPAKFEVFTMENLSEMAGEISGNIQISGYTDAPELDGFLHFEQTTLRVNALNMKLEMPDEKLVFNRKEIIFDQFDLLDENKTPLTINGKIDILDLSNPSFGLNLKTRGFQPVNSTSADNDLFYGTLMLDMAVEVSGDAGLPVVDADISIRNGTNLTYVMPGSEIELVSSEGIVNFINPYSEIDSIFNPEIDDYITDSVISRVSGMDMSLTLQLDPLAKFTVLVDPNSGDFATVSGSANLNILFDPGGGQTITGVFEVTEGIYSLSFYGLVKRVFTFDPGSSIAWSGDPFAANMNFTARHTVRTQSLALVANETSGMTDAERNMFRQRLPYDVLLNIKGFLTEPEIGFRIELPENFLINYPQVASKLTLLNSGQMDSELNKQVFALLVTGSFIADNPFASTGVSAENFVTTAARNSVNGILSEQLNRVSSRYIKNVDVNFGLTSYEDFSGDGSQTRTELDVQVSKKLLNDRLTIEASGTFDVEGNRQYSGTATGHTYGEFSATYDITENGEYRLRLYRENAYDLFDGEVAYSGIAFIIQKSFNALFQRTPKTKMPAAIIIDDDMNLNEGGGIE